MSCADISSDLHDCCVTSSRWICPRWSISCSVRLDPRTFFPYHSPDVRLWSPTTGATGSQEALRERQPLGLLRRLQPANEHLNTLPSPALCADAYHFEENCFPGVSIVCIRPCKTCRSGQSQGTRGRGRRYCRTQITTMTDRNGCHALISGFSSFSVGFGARSRWALSTMQSMVFIIFSNLWYLSIATDELCLMQNEVRSRSSDLWK